MSENEYEICESCTIFAEYLDGSALDGMSDDERARVREFLAGAGNIVLGEPVGFGTCDACGLRGNLHGWDTIGRGAVGGWSHTYRAAIAHRVTSDDRGDALMRELSLLEPHLWDGDADLGESAALVDLRDYPAAMRRAGARWTLVTCDSGNFLSWWSFREFEHAERAYEQAVAAYGA